MTRSTANQKWPGNPPLPGACHTWPRFAVVRTLIVIDTPTPITTHAPNRSSHLRTTRIGPPSASSVHTTATAPSHSHLFEKPYTRIDIWFATSDNTQNCNPVHPTSCTMLRMDGRYEPR